MAFWIKVSKLFPQWLQGWQVDMLAAPSDCIFIGTDMSYKGQQAANVALTMAIPIIPIHVFVQ